MAETETHRDDMMDLIQTAQDHFAEDPWICVSGNMLMFDEEGNRRKHVSPDVFVVRGIPRQTRQNYLVWVEGKGPDLVIELTSRSTRRVDVGKKRTLYQDVLRVPESFLFDPNADYLRPSFQGYRLIGERYQPIEPVADRIPSAILGLDLARQGKELRLYEPATGRRLPTPRERAAQAEADRQRAEADFQQAEFARQQAEFAIRQAEAQRDAALAEADTLRRELAKLRWPDQNLH